MNGRVHYNPHKKEWIIVLDEYQRTNLLWLLNACGYPHGQGVEPFTVANTGDWLGEVALMLARPGEDCVLGPDDRLPNSTNDDLRMRVKWWREQQ